MLMMDRITRPYPLMAVAHGKGHITAESTSRLTLVL